MATSPSIPTELGTEKIGRLLKQYALPAIIAQTADIAQQLAREMTTLGLHIPGSISLCCMEVCDALPALRRGEALRSVTCTQFDYKELGKALAGQLLQLQGAPVQAAQHTLLNQTLAVGMTTAKCKAEP